MELPIRNHTRRGELVYDPFLGSGTTLIAAETTGRICCGLELDPKYVDVIIARWQQATGKTATLDGSGATFEQVQSERSKEPKPPKLEIVARNPRRRPRASDREKNRAA
jgi:DNA modification methylase